MPSIKDKLVKRDNAADISRQLRQQGKIVIFTNGCFDIIHRGHVEYLEYARGLGDVLFVAVNSDSSVKRLKGNGRPINTLSDRMYVLAGLSATDYITYFDEDTPYNIIKEIKPNLLVKAGDYRAEQVVGKDIVESYGGRVIIAPYKHGYSTTETIEKLRNIL